jgi:hypothetical protein
MIKTPRVFAVSAAIAIGLFTAPALTGCSVESLVKNATGGNVDLGGASKPSDFPEGIPLADGTIIAGAGLGTGKDKVWNVTVETGSENPTQLIKSQLEGAGFTAEGNLDLSSEQGGTLFLTDETFGVTVLVGKTDANWTANYTVIHAAE